MSSIYYVDGYGLCDGNYLEHYGVKGMKWRRRKGIRNPLTTDRNDYTRHRRNMAGDIPDERNSSDNSGNVWNSTRPQHRPHPGDHRPEHGERRPNRWRYGIDMVRRAMPEEYWEEVKSRKETAKVKGAPESSRTHRRSVRRKPSGGSFRR